MSLVCVSNAQFYQLGITQETRVISGNKKQQRFIDTRKDLGLCSE